MEGGGPRGSLGEGEEAALPGPGGEGTRLAPLRSLAPWPGYGLSSSLLTALWEWPYLAPVKSLWAWWCPAQAASAPSPPMPQAHVRQENDPPNEENPQPNEQSQEDEFVVVKDFSNFTIQVRVTGRTGDCENYFLNEVTKRLLKHEIRLKTEDYREDSDHFLVVFCPVTSRVGTDMQNALEGLQGEPKAVLVMLHHRPKEYDHFLDTKLQAQHPAVVRTIHTRYTLEDGLYKCQVNEEAVAAVAEVLKDHLQEEQEVPATPDPTMDSRDQMCSNSAQDSHD